MADLREQATENAKKIVQRSVETASQQAREAADRFTKTLGFTGEDSERLARQSKQNMEAVTRCGTVLTQAFQDASRSWFGLAQSQWQRNLDGLSKLAHAKSIQEFTVIQSDLVRESLSRWFRTARRLLRPQLAPLKKLARPSPASRKARRSFAEAHDGPEPELISRG